MRTYKFGSWAAPVGLALVGTGATVAALNEFKGIGITMMAVGGVLGLVGLIAFVFGLWAYLEMLKTKQEDAEKRERAGDERDAERLDIERRHLEVQQQRLNADREMNSATSADQIIAAKASAEAALSVEQQTLSAEKVTKEQWLGVAKNYEDAPRIKILEAELEINRLRMAAVERDLEEVRALMPDVDQRKREAVEAIDEVVRRAML